MSEFTTIFSSSLVVSARSLFGSFEKPEVDIYPIVHDSSFPLVLFFSKTYSSVAASIFRILFITAILQVSSFPQILSTIVERVVIFVVGNYSRLALKNLVTHFKYVFCSDDVAFGVKAFGEMVPVGEPIELIKVVEILLINCCNLILSQGDKAVRFVKRLDNLVSGNTAFRHFPSFKGRLLPAAILA